MHCYLVHPACIMLSRIKVCIGKSFHPNFLTSSLFFCNCCGAHGEGEAGRKPVFLCVLVYVVYLTGRALDMVSLIHTVV
jgi:hypothetical protein